MLWCIGDGQLVHIWGDDWLPTSSYFQIQWKAQMLDSRANVACLIDSETKAWDRQLIFQLFTSEEVAIISNILLILLGAVDKLAWWPIMNELFSVKSAYTLKMNRDK